MAPARVPLAYLAVLASIPVALCFVPPAIAPKPTPASSRGATLLAGTSTKAETPTFPQVDNDMYPTLEPELEVDVEKSKGFSVRNAHYFVTVGRISYLTQAEAKKEAKELGLTPFKWFETPAPEAMAFNEDTQAFVASTSDAIIVVFRGTETGGDCKNWGISDWVTNLDIVPTKFESASGEQIGYVHSGFNEALDTVWPGMLAEIRKQCEKEGGQKPVYVAGHSLGGALASLAAARLQLFDGVDVTAVYTIGSPRAFDSTLAAKYGDVLGKVTFRTVNNNDIVPTLPPGYKHVDTLKYINRDGKVTSGACSFNRFMDQARAWVDEGISDGIDDHSGKEYQAHLARACLAEMGKAAQMILPRNRRWAH